VVVPEDSVAVPELVVELVVASVHHAQVSVDHLNVLHPEEMLVVLDVQSVVPEVM